MTRAEILDEIIGSARGMNLRAMYETLIDYKELAKEFGLDDVEQSKGVVRWKKRIRAKLERDEIERNCRRLIYEWGDCSYLMLVRLGEFACLADADDYFMWFEYKEYVPSQYDCTGQHSTAWYRVFKRNGIYYAYHCISVDV